MPSITTKVQPGTIQTLLQLLDKMYDRHGFLIIVWLILIIFCFALVASVVKFVFQKIKKYLISRQWFPLFKKNQQQVSVQAVLSQVQDVVRQSFQHSQITQLMQKNTMTLSKILQIMLNLIKKLSNRPLGKTNSLKMLQLLVHASNRDIMCVIRQKLSQDKDKITQKLKMDVSNQIVNRPRRISKNRKNIFEYQILQQIQEVMRSNMNTLQGIKMFISTQKVSQILNKPLQNVYKKILQNIRKGIDIYQQDVSQNSAKLVKWRQQKYIMRQLVLNDNYRTLKQMFREFKDYDQQAQEIAKG